MSQPNSVKTTVDHLLNGRVALEQPHQGYRVAVDPVFLAAAVAAHSGDRILDLGVGTGAAALCLLARVPKIEVVGIEIDPLIADLAQQNALRNNVHQRLHIFVGDIAAPPSSATRSLSDGFDHVMANPPYLVGEKFSAPHHAQKQLAHQESTADLAIFVKTAMTYLKPKGSLTLIHRADRLGDILSILTQKEMGSIVIYPLWPGRRRDGICRDAKRILVQVIVGKKAPLRLAAGLTLHQAGGEYTPEAEAVLRGGTALLL
ncbi:MAG: methyltransferase [Alphaproteobacteria bacterium]